MNLGLWPLRKTVVVIVSPVNIENTWKFTIHVHKSKTLRGFKGGQESLVIADDFLEYQYIELN